MGFHPIARRHLLRKILLFIVLVVLVAAVYWWRGGQPDTPKVHGPSSTQNINTSKSSSPLPGFNKNQYSVNDPASIWVVVNKGRVLPSDYAPTVTTPSVPLNYSSSSNDSHVRSETARALEDMLGAAKSEGYSLKLFSGYRSFSEQVSVYGNFVASQGQASADTSSARPGHSEHQTGLAADVGVASGQCDIQACFGDMPEGKWVAANAYKYGFVVRYQKGQESLTGYEYEPWHLRYIGIGLAAQLHQTGQSLEQFFGLPSVTDYPAKSYELKAGA